MVKFVNKNYKSIIFLCFLILKKKTIDTFLIRISLGMRTASERRRYNVTTSLIGWAYTKTDPCLIKLGLHRYMRKYGYLYSSSRGFNHERYSSAILVPSSSEYNVGSIQSSLASVPINARSGTAQATKLIYCMFVIKIQWTHAILDYIEWVTGLYSSVRHVFYIRCCYRKLPARTRVI